MSVVKRTQLSREHECEPFGQGLVAEVTAAKSRKCREQTVLGHLDSELDEAALPIFGVRRQAVEHGWFRGGALLVVSNHRNSPVRFTASALPSCLGWTVQPRGVVCIRRMLSR